MLVIMTVCHPEDQGRPEGDIVIKFREESQKSQSVLPDMYEKCFDMPSMLIFGSHVFLVMPSLLYGWALFYLVDREFQILAEVEGYNECITYYDGLIHYFRSGSHHVLQPQLDGEPVLNRGVSSSCSGSVFDLVFLGKRNDCWGYRYMVVPTHLGTFIVDVGRGLMVRAVEDGDSGYIVAGGGS